MTDIFEHFDLTPVINASGTMTTLGASRVSPEIAASIADMLGRFVLMSELQERASATIASATGAEAGVVTSSSSAAMTLAIAAALVGDDLAAIEALPATGNRERRVIVQMGHMINYGGPVPQAIAAAGAIPVSVGTAALCETYHLEAALADGAAAALYVVSHHTVREGELPMALFIEVCHRYKIPVIVDMASEYDLTTAIALGADAVIWSGHKFLAGPTSGIIAGKRSMIRSIYLQNRGLGRLMKVGKEGVAGAILALEAWQRRNPHEIAAREEVILRVWEQQLSGLPGVSLSRLPDWTGNPITRIEMHVTPKIAGLFAWELADRLMAGSPAIALRDDHAEHQRLQLDPCNVTMAEAEIVADAIRTVLDAALKSGDGCRMTWTDVKRSRGTPVVPWLE